MRPRRLTLFSLLAVLCLLVIGGVPRVSAADSLTNGGFELEFTAWIREAGNPLIANRPTYSGRKSLWLGEYGTPVYELDRVVQTFTKSDKNNQKVCFRWYLRSTGGDGSLTVKLLTTNPTTGWPNNMGYAVIDSTTIPAAARGMWHQSCFPVDPSLAGSPSYLYIDSSTTGATRFFVDNVEYITSWGF